MGRCAVEVEVIFLHILTMIALAVGQTKKPFLENRIASVPEREREAEPLTVIRNSGQPVLAPMIGTRTSLIMAEVRPGIAVVTVILANGPPLTFAEVGSPTLPV